MVPLNPRSTPGFDFRRVFPPRDKKRGFGHWGVEEVSLYTKLKCRIQLRGPWLLGAPLVVLRALRGATGGASEWRPPLAWCQEVLRNPYAHHGGRLQLPERGPRTKGALGKFLRFAQGHNPWASCWWNHLKASAHARAMD